MQLADHFLALVIPIPLDGTLTDAVPTGWRNEAEQPNAAFTAHLKQKYYAHFLACMHPVTSVSTTATVQLFSTTDQRTLTIGTAIVAVQSIELRAFDQDLGMVTVLLRLQADSSMDTLDRVAGAVREPLTSVSVDGGTTSFMDHLAALLAPWTITADRLVAFGPNFKVFVNAVLDLDALEDPAWDDHLFELGTGLPHGGMKEAYAPTTDYRAAQVQELGIKVFRNWRALALFDTFTRLALRSDDPHKSWEKDYLCIYQYVHLLRAQALALSSRLGGMALNDVALLDQRDRWMELRNNVDLAFVSYKWLPNELFAHMMQGTNTLHEMHRADERLERMMRRFKERRSRNLTRVGLVMLGLIVVLLIAFSDLF